MRWWPLLLNDEESYRLIVGLGNPGAAYEETRHNIGFRVVKALADKYRLSFRAVSQLEGEVAKGIVQEKKTLLFLPMTYMNESGHAVKRCLDYFKVPLEALLVISDEIYLPFGNMRLRKEGSSGGHKGLKSIEAHLGLQSYARLRIGISDRKEGELEDYVLGRFTSEEREKLPEIVEKACEQVLHWLK
jgi:peptidyl-tRNA hydrolase, PTH1 family